MDMEKEKKEVAPKKPAIAKGEAGGEEKKRAKKTIPVDEKISAGKGKSKKAPKELTVRDVEPIKLMENGVPSCVTLPDVPRERILKLGQMITDRIGHKVKKEDPEYWGLAAVVTDAMSDVALCMRVRKPMTIEEIMKATGKSKESLEKILHEMSMVGLIEYNWENPQRVKQYVLPMFVPGSAEFTNMNTQQLLKNPELAFFFERMTRLPLEKVTPMVPPGGAGIGMHVIPVEKAIDVENKSLDIEHISHWLKKYEGKYAAGLCSCRLSRMLYDEGCGDDPDDWCIGVGDMADYLVETDKGRYVTYDEVMDILQRAEDNGFVHQITNIDGENKIFAICNCNVNICHALRTSQLFNTPNMSRSAYVARVEKADCVACGGCVEVCPAGAVKLGQKLCTKDGEIEYPKHDLPDRMKWGPDKWDENYRDTNRINCYDTGTAPCKTACPAHISVQGYLKFAAQGEYTKALASIKKENPFPAVCGRICNRPCEDVCTRGDIDEPVAIDEVKKFIAKKDLDSKTRYIPPIITPTNHGGFEEKVAIIGAGPAGLSCAYYLATKGYKPTVFEKNKKPGGMLTYGIPAYKLEKDVIEAEIDIIRKLGVEIKCGVEVGKTTTIERLRKQGYKAFYIAIGCQEGKLPGIPGDDAVQVSTALDFLRGVADEKIKKVGGNVVVIGGGNVAMDVARTAGRLGPKSVKLFSLESREEMPASEEEILEALEENIQMEHGWGPKEIIVKEGKVKGVVFKKCVSVYDENKNFAPQYDEEETITVKCDKVYMSVGQTVQWGKLLDGIDLEFAKGRWPAADKLTYQTSVPDIFVGGDVFTGPYFAIDAIAAGKEAAVSIHRFVQPHTTLTIGRNRREYIQLNKENVVIESYDSGKRQKPHKNSRVDAKTDFKEPMMALTEKQVKSETARCLACGAAVVDENKCIGCGLCTTKCGFDAIKIYRERPECSKMVKTEDKLKAILPYMIKRKFKIMFGGKGNK